MFSSKGNDSTRKFKQRFGVTELPVVWVRKEGDQPTEEPVRGNRTLTLEFVTFRRNNMRGCYGELVEILLLSRGIELCFREPRLSLEK